MLRKSFALFLCMSLLGQNALFAAPAAEAQPQTLAQYQQRAKEDLQRAPWISNEGIALLSLGGTAVGLGIVQHIIHKRQIKELTENFENQLHNARVMTRKYQQIAKQEHQHQYSLVHQLEEKNRALQEQLGISNSRASKWKKQYNSLVNSDRGWQQARIAQLEKEIASLTQQLQKASSISANKSQTIRVMHNRIVELKKDLQQLQARFNQKKGHYTAMFSYSHDWEKELNVYEKLFDKNLPASQRAALRAQLLKEPWLQAVTEAQRKEFMHFIDEGMSVSIGGGKITASEYMRYMLRWCVEKNLPLFERMVAICRHIFHSKNLPAIALLVVLGASAHNAHAQKQADRINTNFRLFLNATPKQLAAMEKDEELRKICIQGAEALHQMSLMSPSEASFLKSGLKGIMTAAPKAGARGTINLAR